MVYGLTIASGAVLIAVVIGRQIYRGTSSFIAVLLRHALTFLLPFFLVALLYAVLQYWLGVTSDMLHTATTIAELERAIVHIQLFSFMRSMSALLNPLALLVGLILLGLLPFVGARLPVLGTSKRTSATIGGMAIVLTLVVSFAFLAQFTAPVIAEQPAKLSAHIAEIERKTAQYKREVEEVIRDIVKGALIEALGATTTAEHFRTARKAIRTAQEQIAVHAAYLNTPDTRFTGATFAAEFTKTWERTQDAIHTLYRDRQPPRPTIADVGRATWSTLQFYEASAGIRLYRLSGATEAPSDLHEIIDKTFDVVYASQAKPSFEAVLGSVTGHPLDLLVLAFEDVLYTPITALLAEQATALFRETMVQKRRAQDVVPEVRTRVRQTMDALEVHLRPRLERVAQGLQYARDEVLRVPQQLHDYAERTYLKRLQAFQRTWQNHVHFASGASAAETGVTLRHQLEATLGRPTDPLEKLKVLATYETELHSLAQTADDLFRYQTLMQLERAHLGTRAFARVAKHDIESRLGAQPGTWGTMSASLDQGRDLEKLEERSRWLQTHRLAVESALEETGGDPSTVREQGTRSRILESLAFETQFLVWAILEAYKPDDYTEATLRKCIRAYAKLAKALEPSTAEGGEFVDTASGNLTGRSAKGALRFQVVEVLARTEAKLRLSLAPEFQNIANVVREERDTIAIYRNGSETRYVNAMFGLWEEADSQPEVGAQMSEVLLEAMAYESREMNVPAGGALRALRGLVDEASYKARQIVRIREELARGDAQGTKILQKALTQYTVEFLWLQKRIRAHWADTRRKLRLRAAFRGR